MDKKVKWWMIVAPIGAFFGAACFGALVMLILIVTNVVKVDNNKLGNGKNETAQAVVTDGDANSLGANENNAGGDNQIGDKSDEMIDSSKADVSVNASDNNSEIASANNSSLGNFQTYGVDGLSMAGDGYEGTKGTGNYNYGEALQKSILFYELQRSGKLPEGTRTNWRGDSCLNDGKDAGLDLSGGWFDAGDNVKFNLPMAYTAAMLGWSVYEDYDAYKESGQLVFQLNNIRYACDYFIKCHPQDEVYYYQVGDGGQDHSWWGPAELVETRMDRPSYCVTATNPGSCVTGETAAALAVASILFEKEDPEYSKLCLAHAKSLYAFSEKYKSDAGYTAANGFYTSWSGFYDELSWAGAWLYLATGDNDYLKKAKEYYTKANQDYNWAMCWDDVHIGAAVLLAEITEDKTYSQAVEKHLDWWTSGADGQRINYSPKGLAWLDNWGSLRYATTTAYIASIYSQMEQCPKDKSSKYWDFAVAQADYALGSSGRSFMVGFGENYPKHVHHRTAQGSYTNNLNDPQDARHILIGALAGGPDAGDNYTDEVSNYNNNEVACDYNAGFTGLLARLYSKYKGQTIKNLGAMEEPGDEFFTEICANVLGDDFIEIKAYIYNESAWPARGNKDLEVRYFVDLSEIYSAGGDVNQVQITSNYVQALNSTELVEYDKDNHIYYLSMKFNDDEVYPGGQECYRKEVQIRMRNTLGKWDNSNDYSYEGMTTGNMIPGKKLAVYEGGKLVYGSEP